MKTNMKTIVTLGLFLSLFYSVNAQDAAQILKKVDEVMYAAKDQSDDIKMIITEKNGTQTVREASTKQKGSSMRIFRFTSPASQAGIAMLSLPNEIMYLYLPAFGKERRIASHVKNQKFSGTDFSYDDMESKPFSEKYEALSIKTEGDCYVLELKPKDENSDYSKTVASILKSNNYLKKVEFYDKTNKKIKELVNDKIEKIGNYWMSTDMTMTDLKTGHKTQMIFTNVKFDSNLSDDEFTVRKLMQ